MLSSSSIASFDASLIALGASADFTGISRAPLALSQVSQSEAITISESGTDARGASTATVGFVTVSPHVLTATFDHPFVFLIRDDSTGAVLFEAVVANPSTAT